MIWLVTLGVALSQEVERFILVALSLGDKDHQILIATEDSSAPASIALGDGEHSIVTMFGRDQDNEGREILKIDQSVTLSGPENYDQSFKISIPQVSVGVGPVTRIVAVDWDPVTSSLKMEQVKVQAFHVNGAGQEVE